MTETYTVSAEFITDQGLRIDSEDVIYRVHRGFFKAQSAVKLAQAEVAAGSPRAFFAALAQLREGDIVGVMDLVESYLPLIDGWTLKQTERKW